MSKEKKVKINKNFILTLTLVIVLSISLIISLYYGLFMKPKEITYTSFIPITIPTTYTERTTLYITERETKTITIIVFPTITITQTAIFTETLFERLEIISAYAEKESVGFKITLEIKNTGSMDVTINEILINGKPLSVITTFSPIMIKPGVELIYYIKLLSGFTSGQVIDIVLHSTSGKDYSKSVVLP